MARYIVSFDVDYDPDRDADYDRTRDAVIDAIEKHAHCKVLDTFYLLRTDLSGEDLRDNIVTQTKVNLINKKSMPYHLAVYEAGAGYFHKAKDGVLDCLKSLRAGS